MDEGTGVPTSIGGGGNSLFSGHCFLNSLDLEEGDEEPASSFSPLQADPNDNSTSTGKQDNLKRLLLKIKYIFVRTEYKVEACSCMQLLLLTHFK